MFSGKAENTMREPLTHVTLRHASLQLGVHEQTLRSWEKRGLIRMVRLPGSGYRRVPVAEVERLRNEMSSAQGRPAVRLEPPRGDAESLARAAALAEVVRSELVGLEEGVTLDEMMTARRGRAWSS
jgi:DNA-binding transcriptional MerR regulator